MELLQSKYKRYNEDLLPIQGTKRSWGAINFFTLWTTNVHNIPGYLLIGGLFTYQIQASHFMWLIFLSGLILSAAMSLGSHAGAKYGLPFVILLRDAYGHKGALLPSFIRSGLVAIMWLALQTYVGSAALLVIVAKLSPEIFATWKPVRVIGLPMLDVLAYLACMLINVYLSLGGSQKLKLVIPYINIAIFMLFTGMTLWVIHSVGLPHLFSTYAVSNEVNYFHYLIVINAILAVWAAPLVSSSDFSRFAVSNRAQMLGQSIGITMSYALMAITGISILSGYSALFSQNFWSVLDIIHQFDSVLVLVLSTAVLVLATVTTNVTSNIYPAAQLLMKTLPKLSYRNAVWVIAGLSTLLMPWELMQHQNSIIAFLTLIGSMLGPVYGVITCHYFSVSKRIIDVDALYLHCKYPRAINHYALLATAIGFLVSISGMFIAPLSFLTDISWLSGTISAACIYKILLSRRRGL
ncbi:cytosine permease [Vibrio sp.]|uniref:cytosine permease n=1 Tax=Vibrio sp. TaxID=678 RepID=UPI003D136BA9